MKITILYNKIIVIATISVVGLQRVAAHVGVRAGQFGLCRSGVASARLEPDGWTACDRVANCSGVGVSCPPWAEER